MVIGAGELTLEYKTTPLHNSNAREGNRTLVSSLEGVCSATALAFLNFVDEASTAPSFSRSKVLERAMRIELTYQAWKACVLPLNYARKIVVRIRKSQCGTIFNKFI